MENGGEPWPSADIPFTGRRKRLDRNWHRLGLAAGF